MFWILRQYRIKFYCTNNHSFYTIFICDISQCVSFLMDSHWKHEIFDEKSSIMDSNYTSRYGTKCAYYENERYNATHIFIMRVKASINWLLWYQLLFLLNKTLKCCWNRNLLMICDFNLKKIKKIFPSDQI